MPYCHLLFGSFDKPHVKLIMQIPLGKLKHLFHTSPDFKVKAFLKVSFQPQPNRKVCGLLCSLVLPILPSLREAIFFNVMNQDGTVCSIG